VNKPVQRSLVWLKAAGAELVDVELTEGRLTAIGTAIGAVPVPYRLNYALITGENYVTRTLQVRTTGAGWRRSVALRRDDDGSWRVEVESEGELAGPAAGGDLTACVGALDAGLALSPIAHSPPVLRHGLLGGGEPVEQLVPWVAVPSLAIEPVQQCHTHLLREGGMSLVRYEWGDLTADLVFDRNGLVVDYPGVARRADAGG
jgi:hypothetical protein